MTATPAYPLGYVRGIDGFRGVAILLVLIFHVSPRFTGGYLGVDLFFVLSGFLITGILLRAGSADGFGLLGFYRRRALRLLPALFAFCLLFLAFALVALPDFRAAVTDVAVSLASVANWTRAFSLGIPRHLGHMWSLSIEDQFYLLWPVLLFALIRYAGRRGALVATLVLIVACAAWRIVLTLNGETIERLYNGFDTRCDTLLVGCALALSGIGRPDGAPAVAAAVRVLWLPCVAALVAIMAAFQWVDRPMFLGGYTLVALLGAVLILATLQQTRFARVMEYTPLVATGRISYALYIWHYPVWFVLHLDYGLSILAAGLLTIPLSFAAAAASYFVVERPFLNLRYAATGPSSRLTGRAAAGFMAGAFACGVGFFIAPAMMARVLQGPVEIVDFGPRRVALGESFNRQPSGNSAMWIKTNSVPTTARIRFNGTVLSTVVSGTALSAEIPAALLAQPGPLPIALVSPQGQVLAGPVTFEIKPAP